MSPARNIRAFFSIAQTRSAQVVLALIAILAGALAGAPPAHAGKLQRSMTVPGLRPPAFPVFDALGIPAADKSRWFGHYHAIVPIRMIYQSSLWPRSECNKKGYARPNLAYLRRFAQKLFSSMLLCLDIECWPVNGSDREARASITKFEEVADIFHRARPDLKLGSYGVPPIRDYWNAIKPGSAGYKIWLAHNRRLAGLARHVDVIFPSLYTFYDDVPGWQQYAHANIQQARQYGKPVYPFIWPQFHNSNKTLAYHWLPGAFWRAELDTIYQHADGVVIWGWSGFFPKGWHKKHPAWVDATRNFLTQLNPRRR